MALRAQFRLVAVAALVLSLAACNSYRSEGSRTLGEFTDDVGIQASVKSALLRDDVVKGFRIDVDVRRSVVSLYGRVGSVAVRTRATDIARKVRGVSKVVDKLTLVEE